MNDDFYIEELKQQYLHTLAMYEKVLAHCPDNVWTREFGGIPFWREAYHCIFWMHNFAGGVHKQLEKMPFGLDIDPRLFTPPNATCTREQAQSFIVHTKTHFESVFETISMPELAQHDEFGHFRTVLHRLLYGLRHGQHHIGKLTGWLYSIGIDFDHWQG